MSTYLFVIGLVFLVMLFGVTIDRIYRAFAAKNPQLGPFRNSERGCGSCTAGSGCSGKTTACDQATASR